MSRLERVRQAEDLVEMISIAACTPEFATQNAVTIGSLYNPRIFGEVNERRTVVVVANNRSVRNV